ncbi:MULTISPECIES: alpha/beta fold hydrolase [unclassified Pseudomonas]|uniref:alpha/beta fold hydrolase n=1 Tax=unclassified Pseudomonas TaxID=196821 RepID=UPI00088F0C53|nr:MULTISPECIES: endopeptidase [unclassified Pseudomonas]QVM94519.1 endopeptidase [Pseudomonas sp. SORT22]UVL58624.1 endopeptidase [Pseudomonas sp. B21-035]SDQ74642.1 hypothetical protein SAMN05216487_3651 [Pseudomonas sp. UC 17F4]
MKVVFIHGRSQQGKNPLTLQNTWTNALIKGFEGIGSPYPGVVDVAFPYYGDLLFDETYRRAQKDFQVLTDKGADAAAPGGEEEEFMRQVIYDIAKQQGISKEQINAEANGEMLEKGVQNWRGVLAALRLLDQLPGVGATSVELFTRDVWYYLTEKTIRDAVNKLVDAQLPENDPCIVVAHSLGTIIAYNLLMNRPARSNIKGLVTLGSPLGIEAILSRLPSNGSPRKAPDGVPSWVNIRDKRDVVALYEIPAARFSGAPAVQNHSNASNGSDNRHGIVEYLNDTIVAGVLRPLLA